jgi:Flp pilus assembly protein TadG
MMMRSIDTNATRARTGLRAESGQALVETALVGLFLLTLLVGGIDFGRFTYDGILLGNAARAGVQYGSQNLTTAADTAGMIDAATSDNGTLVGTTTPTAGNFCKCGNTTYTCTATQPSACNTSPRLVYVTVTTQGVFTPWITFPGIPSTISLSRTATMQVSP